MAINKVIYDGETLIDTTGVSVTPETLAEGETALNAAGDEIVGTLKVADEIVTTAGTGSAYTATVNGIKSLTAGVNFIMIPHVVSASTAPTLNVNGLGAKTIRQPLTTNTSATTTGTSATWLAVNKPVRVMYDGTYWKTVEIPRPSATGLYGTTPITSGGTGATTKEAACTNLGAVSYNAQTLTDAQKLQVRKNIGVDDIPDYVVTEAESVIDRVVAAQGSRTFTIAAISDLHYGNSSYTDGILHACQALKYIDSRIKLDAVAILGDYTDGYPSTGIADAMADFKGINAMLESLRFAPNIRQQGNHDYYADNIPITRRLIQFYSDDVVWGSRNGGYFYRDFDNYKIRVICPNTNENNPMDTSTNKPASNLSMTTEQINWLIATMDLSGKADAEEWGILILSHHPLDYWATGDIYILGNVLNAYQTGGSWNGGGVSCNFSGKNKAKLIGNIHGHIHNLLVANMFMGSPNNGNQSDVYRSCVPNACYGRENQYTGVWADATTYSKTQNSADDTAFMVYCIDLDKFTVTGICYGAGADRNWVFGEVPLETYTITNNLTNITTSNTAETITEGMAYTATLTPAGDNITSVTVVMGGVNVTSSVYSNGVISIPAVTGNIVITAVGEEKVEIINLLDTVGYTDNTRLSSSSGSEKTQSGHVATGYIDISGDKMGDVIRTSGINFGHGTYPDQAVYVRYDANKNMVACGYIDSVYRIGPYLKSIDASGNLTLTFDAANSGDNATSFFRMSGMGVGANGIITKNQPIE